MSSKKLITLQELESFEKLSFKEISQALVHAEKGKKFPHEIFAEDVNSLLLPQKEEIISRLVSQLSNDIETHIQYETFLYALLLDKKGVTAKSFLTACKRGNYSVLLLLLQAQPDIIHKAYTEVEVYSFVEKDKKLKVRLWGIHYILISQVDHLEQDRCIQLLLSYGANPNSTWWTPLHHYIYAVMFLDLLGNHKRYTRNPDSAIYRLAKWTSSTFILHLKQLCRQLQTTSSSNHYLFKFLIGIFDSLLVYSSPSFLPRNDNLFLEGFLITGFPVGKYSLKIKILDNDKVIDSFSSGTSDLSWHWPGFTVFDFCTFATHMQVKIKQLRGFVSLTQGKFTVTLMQLSRRQFDLMSFDVEGVSNAKVLMLVTFSSKSRDSTFLQYKKQQDDKFRKQELARLESLRNGDVDIISPDMTREIFNNLDFNSIVRCRLVCARWRQIIDTSISLWNSKTELETFILKRLEKKRYCDLMIPLASSTFFHTNFPLVKNFFKRTFDHYPLKSTREFIDERISLTVKDFQRISNIKDKILYLTEFWKFTTFPNTPWTIFQDANGPYALLQAIGQLDLTKPSKFKNENNLTDQICHFLDTHKYLNYFLASSMGGKQILSSGCLKNLLKIAPNLQHFKSGQNVLAWIIENVFCEENISQNEQIVRLLAEHHEDINLNLIPDYYRKDAFKIMLKLLSSSPPDMVKPIAYLMSLDPTLGPNALFDIAFNTLAAEPIQVKKKFLKSLCQTLEFKESYVWNEKHWIEICLKLPIILSPLGEELKKKPFAPENSEVWDNLKFLLPVLRKGIGEDRSLSIDEERWPFLLNIFFTGLDKDTPGLQLYHEINAEYLKLLISFYDIRKAEAFWNAGGAKYIFDFDSFPPKVSSLILTDWIGRTHPDLLTDHIPLFKDFLIQMYETHPKGVFNIMKGLNIEGALAERIWSFLLSSYKHKKILYSHISKLQLDPDWLLSKVSYPETFKTLILQTTDSDFGKAASSFITDIMGFVIDDHKLLTSFLELALTWAPNFYNFPPFINNEKFKPLIIEYLQEILLVTGKTEFSQDKWISQILVETMHSDCSEIYKFFQTEQKFDKTDPSASVRINGLLAFAENILESRDLFNSNDNMREPLVFECVKFICNQCFENKNQEASCWSILPRLFPDNSSQDLIAHFIRILITVISQNFETNTIQTKRLNELEQKIKDLEKKK